MCAFRKYQKNKKGFTLIELLTSIVIFSFLSGAVYVSLAQGLRVWKFATEQTRDWKQDLFVESFRSDLRNAVTHASVSVKGGAQHLEFYTLLPDARRSQKIGESNRIPARVEYSFDAAKNAIMKETVFYEKILYPTGKEGSVIQTAMEQVQDVRFEYFRHPEGKVTAASWQSKWDAACFPEAVKMILEIKDVRSIKKAHIFALPARGSCAEEKKV
ncbi:MAG TPA: hypothetical protein DIS66_08070 [Candidatus Omnitrophica bacterium]|nr:hypothetical protein [Candidatus Omnitrophota bacterium]